MTQHSPHHTRWQAFYLLEWWAIEASALQVEASVATVTEQQVFAFLSQAAHMTAAKNLLCCSGHCASKYDPWHDA